MLKKWWARFWATNEIMQLIIIAPILIVVFLLIAAIVIRGCGMEDGRPVGY